MSTEIHNSRDGDTTLILTDPNTGLRSAVHTYPREFEDLVEDQGEFAVVVERDSKTGEVRFIEALLPKEQTFGSAELKVAYLQCARDEKSWDEVASKAFDFADVDEPKPKQPKAHPVSGKPEVKPKIKGVSTGKKYKKVADKVKPVLGTLPSEFRIDRKIIGDPLEGMPKLPTHPPEFTPTGRYTQERKDLMGQVAPRRLPMA
ncbi:hypothetical protein CC1G_15307 [Coprinopsis cinerea okayama7|uniref:Uncharacterized protein n=1 Tax=Coprinopsis cinerea (strain Okayama-7 / 130 / ATCC MYA-4618 / FGSC 9003) TaxID=240176 RepID=D6RPY6_COPC7|nr:hypothetical protein CC1G_15307 [Coprinopsis cinerea okayama7\|eukprot:XP_002910400.1 hypothetical protein CC1G_15307 [Coprinopsis cinerea okayama7\